jgi:biotin carboxyl carrier protein
MIDSANPGRESGATSQSNAETAAAAKPPAKGMAKRWLFAILILTFLFVLMPYLFWQATWFGRPLDDGQMAKAFADTKHPREAQHALSQVADRILSANAATRDSARNWYPQVVSMSSSPDEALRTTAAWVMGQDATVPEFHTRLLSMLADANPMVQRNAALSLVRFGDPSGHDLISAMLKPYTMPAPAAGKFDERLKPGDSVNPGTLVGRIEGPGGSSTEVRTNVPGTLVGWIVPDGTKVAAGQSVAQLDPSSEVVWEALRALYLIGTTQDEAAIAPFARGVSGMPPNVAQQATLTLTAIRNRAGAVLPSNH